MSSASIAYRCHLLNTIKMETSCKECGYPLTGNETSCPECGTAINPPKSEPQHQPQQESSTKVHDNQHQTITINTDWAQYFYECGVIGWEAFKKFASFHGRASRREYWSLFLIFNVCWIMISSWSRFSGTDDIFVATFIVFLIPIIGTSVRRLHDISRSGWWCLCPIVPLFMYLKKSDTGVNKYGSPNPAKNLL